VPYEQSSNRILKEQRGALQARVKLTIDKHPRIEVLLGTVTEVLVLVEDSLEEGVNVFEVFIRGLFMPVNLVFQGTSCCRCRDASHHVEEVRTSRINVSK
jgi:hypothetical protein